MTKHRWPLVLVLALLATGALAGITIEHDESVDFSKYKTYAWKEGVPAIDPKLQAHIEKRIDEQLAERGLRRVTRELPDLYVSTFAHSFTDLHVGATYIYAPTYDVGIIATNIGDVTSGTLMVDLVESESDRAVWHCVAEEKFAGRELAKIKKKIDKITRKMFKDFPPK